MVEASSSLLQIIAPEEAYRSFIAQGIRPDGRSLMQARKTTVGSAVFPNRPGSAIAKLGETKVAAAVSLQIGKPADATPTQGEIEIEMHLMPLCSSRFSVGKPTEQAMALTNFLTRTILSSGMVALEDLCIEEGVSAWRIQLDLVCLNFDGNLIDAGLLAATSALRDLRLPAVVPVEGSEDGGLALAGGDPADGRKLSLKCLPISTTFGLFEGSLICDPTLDEEDIFARDLTACSVTVVRDAMNEGRVSVHKPGGALIAADHLAAVFERSRRRVEEVYV